MNKPDTISPGRMLLLIFVPSSQVHVKAMHQIEQALMKNSTTGMWIGFLSSAYAKITLLADSTLHMGWRELFISWASDIGIIVGLLIACLTFVLKVKEFYEKFFYASKKRRQSDTSTSKGGSNQPQDLPNDDS